MQQNPNYPTERAPGHEHIPLYPKGFVAVRILQLVVGVIVLGLTAYLLAVFIAYAGDCLMIFTAIVNLIVTIYYVVAWFGPKNIYNYWAVLSLDIFMLIFWLVSFAVLASEAADVFALINDVSDYCDSYDSVYCDYYNDYTGDTIYASIMAAAAGVGALEFVLYIVSLAMHSVYVHRHRSAGLHCNPVRSGGTAAVAGGAAPPAVAAEKPWPGATVAPAYTSGVPPYNGQAMPYQQQQQQPPQQHYPPQPEGMAPQQQPQQFYPPQQYAQPEGVPQQAQFSPSPIQAQHTGASYSTPPPHQANVHQLPAEHQA